MRCYPTSSVDACNSTCRSDRPDLALRSSAGVAAERNCLAGLTCDVFTSATAWRDETTACRDQARAAIQPTLASRAFCQDYAQAWFECGDYYPLDDCERSFSMWNPAFYDRLTPCEQEAICDGLDACVRGVFGDLHL